MPARVMWVRRDLRHLAGARGYPRRIVDHAQERQEALARREELKR